MPSCEELIRLNQDALTSAAQAGDYLEKQGYELADKNGSRAFLSYTLLLTHCVPPNILPRGIREVTTLLEHEESTRLSQSVPNAKSHPFTSTLLTCQVHSTDFV